MITLEKVQIFFKYNGDIDSWVRSGSRKEKLIMADNDWYVIGGLLQDLFLIKKGLTSESFNLALNSKLLEICDGKETIMELERRA